MRRLLCLLFVFAAQAALAADSTEPSRTTQQETINRIFADALAHGCAYDQLRELVARYPGRLGGSSNLDGAIGWAQHQLTSLGVDRVFTQDVTVPHWERGAPESVTLLRPGEPPVPLNALALGGTIATPAEGLTAPVIEVRSLADVEALGREKIAGKIVFYNRPMDPTIFRTSTAYSQAGDQRNHGPALAARFGATAVLVRSLTLAHDDVPHTGTTSFGAGQERIPALALSTLAADVLSAALVRNPDATVRVVSHARLLPDAPSHNIIGEWRGSERPDEIIVVGGHLDSWDVAPGAHDDGTGVVAAMEVLRLFKSLDLRPRHTLRCVLFTSEENSGNGGKRYAQLARVSGEKHLFAIESDNGGFAPAGFNLGNPAGDAHERAARWRSLFEPWGVWHFQKGSGGADVGPLIKEGATVAGLMPDSQRYFDYHHTRADTIDHVNPRELHLGAAALAALIWLIDTEGL
ncbi:M20/M25/M40 family metallo-hydrolase [Horticoccus luteus]|uniref:Carboxypeptidase Q n=1 Tax=Horticoccus luteus TaxID=2862869 RepID=A0A8F9XGP8_9BACT|nr:M20/M25/M40 family metallo-hydrolase [Horticoccus luteus]QYM79462.1 M20/M25/M40 family metallo-hydrolase [Horticoccus luteus]